MIESECNTRVWHVVFCSSTIKHWLLNRLKYGHVYAMRKSPGGQYWTVIDPTTSCIDATIVPVEICATPMDYKKTALKSIRVIVKPEEKDRFTFGFDFLSCVLVIKHLLGISRRRIVTPNQLLKYLEQNHG